MKSIGLHPGIGVLFFLLLSSSPLPAAEYFVSPAGNDITGSGTIGSPWRTIEHGLDNVFPGDVLYLRGGIYNEQLVSVRSGTAGSYITIAAYGNEGAFVDGTGVVTGNNGVLISHSYVKLRGFTIRNWAHNGMEIFDCAFLELRNLTVTGVSGGIALTGTVHDFVVDSCIIYDYYGGAGGFGFDATPQGETDTIYNGVISNCRAYISQGAFDNCDGFALGHDGVSGIRFENCEAFGVGDAFDISGVDIRLERCIAYRSSYGGGYKLWRESVTMVNCIGHSNIVNVELDYDSDANRGVHARLINCTLFNPVDANILIENSAGGSTLEMFNCILAGGDNTGLYFDGDTVSGYTGDYNLFQLDEPTRMIAISARDFSLAQIQAGEWTTFSGQDSHTQVVWDATEIFQDTAGVTPDLHLRNGSLAIDNGVTVPDAPAVDFDNCARTVGPIDIGAYEFGACGALGIRDGVPVINDRYTLDQNYPNPFNPTTTIDFELPVSSEVRLSVYDLLGREVCVLVNEMREAGFHQVAYNASGLSSGVYFYRLHARRSLEDAVGHARQSPKDVGGQAGEFVQTRKLLLVR